MILRALLLVLALCGQTFAPSQAFAQGTAAPDPTIAIAPADRRAIQDVITRQLDAFRHDDGPAAYAQAAPVIKELFPTPEIFLDMVRRGYPPVYRPAQQEFSELAMRDGRLVQEVEIVGPDGRPVLALYTMEKQPDGTWLIAACSLIPSARLGV